jgi:hypothetical protein
LRYKISHWNKLLIPLTKKPISRTHRYKRSYRLKTLMFRTPIDVHMKAHTRELAETHVVLPGGTHVFEANGKHYSI